MIDARREIRAAYAASRDFSTRGSGQARRPLSGPQDEGNGRMINETQGGWYWEVLDRSGAGECPQPDVWRSESRRVSALLGPDGEPLMVPFERPAIGFDLRPRSNRK